VRPIHLIVFFAAGGGNDIIARLMGQWLSERLGQQFVIENRPGGGGNIGTEAVVRAAPDGYTLLLVSSPNTTNSTLYDHLNYDFIRDIAPVAGISREPNVMVVNPSVPAKTVLEFIAYAKANAGKINYASAGIGSSQHMSDEMFKMMAGIDMVHVPHRGSAPALQSVLGGEVQVMFASMPSSLEFIRAGKLQALAVTTAIRSAELPDLPPVGDCLPGYEASVFYGIGAGIRRQMLSRDSTRKSMRAWPIASSERGSPTSAARRCRVLLPSSGNLLRAKLKSGQRSSSSRTSRRNDAGEKSITSRYVNVACVRQQLIVSQAAPRCDIPMHWIKVKNPKSPAVKREAEEEWR